MPALFCLALHPALADIQRHLLANELVVAYLDDIYIFCRPERAREIHDLVARKLWDYCRIRINQGKLICWNRQGGVAPVGIAELNTPGHTVWRGDVPSDRNGVTVVGTPIGTDAYIEAQGNVSIEEKQVLLDSLRRITSVQNAWLLLYFCAAPRANHLLRTIAPHQIHPYAIAHDHRITSEFRRLLGLPQNGDDDSRIHHVASDIWERQARLPIRFGGCGLRDCVRTSSAAYWASWADCLEPIARRFPEVGRRIAGALREASLNGARDGIPASLVAAVTAGNLLDAAGMRERPSWDGLSNGARPRAPDPEEVQAGEWQHGWQFWASNALEQQEHTNLLGALAGSSRAGPLPGRARLRSCAGPHAGAWLSSMPTTPALRLDNDEMLCALRRRLGLVVLFDAIPCEARSCRRIVDVHGYHRLACNRTGRIHARHRGLISAWRQVFVEAGGHVPDRNIERMLRDTHVPVESGDSRRLDLVVSGLSVERGLSLFCDVTCVSPITGNGTARSGATTRDGAIVTGAQADNDLNYEEVESSGLGRLFCLGCEVYGRWCSQALRLVPALVAARVKGLPPGVRGGIAAALRTRWWGLLATAVQRLVAQAVLRNAGADLVSGFFEIPPGIADLAV